MVGKARGMENNDLKLKAFEAAKSSLMNSLHQLQPVNKAAQVVEALKMIEELYEQHSEWNDTNATHLVNVAQICLNEIGLGANRFEIGRAHV